MPTSPNGELNDLLVLCGFLSIPFLLALLWVLYRLVRGHRWRQKEILHTNIAILNTNQAILAALMRSLPPARPVRHRSTRGKASEGAAVETPPEEETKPMPKQL